MIRTCTAQIRTYTNRDEVWAGLVVLRPAVEHKGQLAGRDQNPRDAAALLVLIILKVYLRYKKYPNAGLACSPMYK
jgi:hypothetical protein